MKFEIWALHEKVGKGPWQLAKWFTPRIPDSRNSCPAKEYVKQTAMALSDAYRKYKAVRYVVAKNKGKS